MIDKRIVLSALIFVTAVGAQPATTPVSATPAPAAPGAPPTADASSPGPIIINVVGPQSGSLMPDERAEMQRMADEQQRMRRTMLAALTPAHRALLAQMVAELSVADNPDPEGAVSRLNASLSRGESSEIVRIEHDHELMMLRHFQQVAAAAGHPLPEQPLQMQAQMRTSPCFPAGMNAGSILMRTAAMSLLVPKLPPLERGTPQR